MVAGSRICAGRDITDNTVLARRGREVEDISTVQIHPDKFYGGIALESGGEAHVLRDDGTGCRRTDAYAYASDRAGKRQVPRHAEIFLRLVEPAKVVPGIDDQMMRAVRHAAFKQIERAPAILEDQFVVDINLH